MADKKTSASTGKAYNSAALEDIRAKINELDNRIHDTLMERAELVLKIGAEKRKSNLQIIQPAREASLIRRLLDRHKGALPEMAVVRIWRELIGAVSLLQTGLKVTVALPEGQNDYWDLARDYFGSCLPMSKTTTAISAISALNDNKATFAVVPRPLNEDEQPWWTFLGQGGTDPLRIIMSLPHAKDPADPKPDCQALIVGKAGFDESGNDNSFLLIQCEATISRGKLVDLAKKVGLTALGLSSKRTSSPHMPALHLMEVENYMGKADKRVDEFLKSLEDPGANVICVGGYPVPPTYSRSLAEADENILKASA